MPPVCPLFVVQSPPDFWQDGSLAQNLSKALKILMTSSLSCVYDVIKQFSASFKVRDSLSFVQVD